MQKMKKMKELQKMRRKLKNAVIERNKKNKNFQTIDKKSNPHASISTLCLF